MNINALFKEINRINIRYIKKNSKSVCLINVIVIQIFIYFMVAVMTS